MDIYLKKYSKTYRKKEYLKRKLDEELKKQSNLKNKFGRKNMYNKNSLNKMTIKDIKLDIIDKNKKRYKGYSHLKKKELINFIINKQLNDSNRKGHFNYMDLLDEMDKTSLHLNKLKINSFLDICAAPGEYSKYLSDKLNCKGTGVTLPIENGGINFNYKLNNYNLEYLDVINEYDKKFSKIKFDFIISGCLDMTHVKKRPYYDINLWLSTMMLAFLNLNKNGTFAFKISLKYISFASNIMFIFERFFKYIKVFKSKKAIPFRSMFYVIGFDFKFDKTYFDLLKEIYTNYNEKLLNNDIKDFKFKLIFQDTKKFNYYQKLFETLFRIQIKAIQNIL